MKHAALRLLASLLRWLAVLEAVLGVWSAAKAASVADGSGLILAVGLSSTALRVLLTYALAEAIGVLLAIEENTRRAVEQLATSRGGSNEDVDLRRPRVVEPAPIGSPKVKSEPEESDAFVVCDKCGQRTEGDGLFCQKCGKPFAAPPA